MSNGMRRSGLDDLPVNGIRRKGRPPMVLERDKAMRVLRLLSARLSFEVVAEREGLKKSWLAAAYHDKRLHQMAEPQRAGGFPPALYFFGDFAENYPEEESW